MSRDSFNLRMVRVWLNEEHTAHEILATNLPHDLFPTECFGEIYHLRWHIETAYQTLKDRLQMENFTGTKPVFLEQDIYSTIYISNIAEDIARDIEQEQADHLKNDYKHRMAVNRTLCIGLLKSDLIYILLEKDRNKQDELFQQLYDEISKNIIPVRPDRIIIEQRGNWQVIIRILTNVAINIYGSIMCKEDIPCFLEFLTNISIPASYLVSFHYSQNLSNDGLIKAVCFAKLMTL